MFLRRGPRSATFGKLFPDLVLIKIACLHYCGCSGRGRRFPKNFHFHRHRRKNRAHLFVECSRLPFQERENVHRLLDGHAVCFRPAVSEGMARYRRVLPCRVTPKTLRVSLF